MSYVIGVDPGSKKHGVATYHYSELISLDMMNTPELMDYCRYKDNVLLSIENVMANKFVYERNKHPSKDAQSKIAMNVGRNQQAQENLIICLDHYSIPYVLHKPTKANWADNKKYFEAITGWKNRSNRDTRSAAYFGFIALPINNVSRGTAKAN